MRKFNQFKDFVHNKATSRNDRNEVLSQNVLNSEKHVDNIKTALSNAEKKISSSLLSGTSDSSNATPEKKIKKLPSSSLITCFNEASELLSQSKNDSVLGKTLHLCSQLQKESSSTLATHESDIEGQCITKIQTYINEDLPNISRTRKQLNRTHADLNALKVKYDSMKKSMENSSQMSQYQADNKLDTLRKDLEDNQNRLFQCRDAYETEILDFLSKEMSIAQVFYDYVKLQASYHEKMLAQINHYIPVLEGVIANTSQKPVFGVSLEEHLRTSGRQISLVIETCINLLLPSLDEEGIFRISGSVSKVKLIRNAFNAGHLDALDLTRDVHAVASALKSYLRELPEPLLTYKLYQEWINASSERDQQEKLKAIWQVCNQLPEAYKNNLRYLIKFLNELTKHCEINKMSSQNLAIAIGPSLLWSNGEALELSMSNFSPILIEALITYCDYFFPEDVIFDISSKQRANDSISDNSDQEINNGNKQGANYRKKPAPKPPSASSNDNSTSILEAISTSNIDSATSKIRSKFGSLRLTNNKQANNEHIKNQFEQPQRVDSPPTVTTPTATIRRNHLSPRVDNSKAKRPMSIHERPGVPPPEIPPRPSVPKVVQNDVASESTKQRFSMFDLTENDSKSYNNEDNESFSYSEENLDINDENYKSVSSLYPSLSGFQTQDNSDSPFTYPCSEFIDENQPIMYSINENVDNAIDYDNNKCSSSMPPQKPPRSSLSANSNPSESIEQQHQPMVTRRDRSPPPLPIRPSKSPSPIPTANHSVTTHNSANSTMIPTERTYL